MASQARQSMNSDFVDCHVATLLAMTNLSLLAMTIPAVMAIPAVMTIPAVIASEAWQSMPPALSKSK
jgi:hypothetical protein